MSTSDLRPAPWDDPGFVAALDALPAPTWLADLDGRCRYANPEWLALTGTEAADGWMACTHPDDLAGRRAAYREAAMQRIPLRASYRLRTADGTFRWITERANPLPAPDGSVVGYLGTATDVDALEQAEAAQADELRTVLATVPAIVFVARAPSCREIVGSDAAYRLLRLRHGDNLSKSAPPGEVPTTFQVFRGGAALKAHELPVQRAARGEPVHDEELELRFADGEVRHIVGNAAPLFDHTGAPRGAVAAFIDVTERKRSETALLQHARELERTNAELEEFAYVASHDLKAPLRAVSSLAYCIITDAADTLDQDNRRRLHTLRERVIRMHQLIDGLLAYGRVARNLPHPREAVALHPLLAKLVAELPLPPGFAVELREPLPALRADPQHLVQIFANLIDNAIDHHDRSRGSVTVRAEDAGSRWCIEVCDDGPGIPPAARAAIFKMFNTTGAGLGRVGLGLAIARKLVLGYGAAVEVDDNRPRGAVFRLLWPKGEVGRES